LSYPIINNTPISTNFLSNPDVMARRTKSKTVVAPSTKFNSKADKNKIKNVDEIMGHINAGISNLTYVKIDLAIDELEEAVNMLKDQK
jgi:hypothetical protein